MIDSADSSTSTEVMDEVVMSVRPNNASRKRKIHNKDHSSDNQSSDKQRKKVSFLEDQQNSPELLAVDRPMMNVTPILETSGQQQLEHVQTFQTSSNTLDTDSQFVFQTLFSHWLCLSNTIMNSSQ